MAYIIYITNILPSKTVSQYYTFVLCRNMILEKKIGQEHEEAVRDENPRRDARIGRAAGTGSG